jgi:serine phosphatase RsbU (regulator of sigma subunit)
MDLCLCRIDTTNNNLTYAAANNSLYLVSENTITEYKGDKQPIGYHNGEESSFTQHTIQLQKNDLIYTTTDGYPDQFGGEKGKKFRYKNFENLLLEISVMAMQEQHTTIKSKFYEWKKDFEQTDDVCVIGIKI